MAEMVGGDSDAASIAIWAALTYDIISATNSSPQTTEINAKTRAGTLMKWVHIGLIQAVGFAILGVIVESPGKRWRPVLGGGLAGVFCGCSMCTPGTRGCDPPRRAPRHTVPARSDIHVDLRE